jgi:hypothetical protein
MHPEPAADAGPIGRWVTAARVAVARRHRERFAAAGASDVAIVSGPPDALSFGARLRSLVRAERPAGLVVLGSGAIPLATIQDLRDLVAAAGSVDRVALANNRYSADVVAVAHASDALAELPDLASDNALPRWLEGAAGYTVRDLRRRWRLAIDIDGPLDVVLTGTRADGERVAGSADGIDLGPAAVAMAAVRRAADDPRAELLVTGRTSAATLAWLERATASRTRAIVEERGLRTSGVGQRPPASVLGALLDREGPGSIGACLARLCDAAIVDTRVLLAHRLGADESAWPTAEDRYASDLLLAERIRDPWLAALTASATAAPIPILFGGHTLVGPGVRLLVGRRPRTASWR